MTSLFHDSRKGNEVEKRVFTANYYVIHFFGSQCRELTFVCQDKGGSTRLDKLPYFF
jgi:hypothetical protein